MSALQNQTVIRSSNSKPSTGKNDLFKKLTISLVISVLGAIYEVAGEGVSETPSFEWLNLPNKTYRRYRLLHSVD